MKIILLILIFLGSFFCSDVAGLGSSHRYGTNARGISLGNSLVSSYNKGYNSFTNPSLLGLVKSNEYGFSYFSMSLDRSIQTFSISIPVPPLATVALSFFRSGVKDIPSRNSSGAFIENYDSWEGYGMISFGTQFNKKILVGTNIKVLKNKIKDYSASGVGVDFAITYTLNNRNNFSLLINNLYTKYTWENQGSLNNIYEEKFPLILSFGGKYANPNLSNLLVFYKIDYSESYLSTKYNPSLGLEYEYKKIPLLSRFGFKERGQKFEYTLGFGYNFKMVNDFNISIDYALDLGIYDESSSHLFTFTFNK